MQLSQKQRTFSELYSAFFKSELNLKHFEEKYHPHKFCISQITDSGNMTKYMSRKSCFIGHINKRHGKRAIVRPKSPSQQFNHISWSLSRQFSWKKLLLLARQILRLLFNTLALDDKYPVSNREILMMSIEMQLLQK